MRALLKGLLAGGGAAGVTMVLTLAPASAQTVSTKASTAAVKVCTSPDPTPPTGTTPPSGTNPVIPSTAALTSATPSSASTAAAAPATSSQLAFTGADVAGSVGVAGLLVGGGILLVGASRRRSNADLD